MTKASIAASVCWSRSRGSGKKYMIRNTMGPRKRPIVCRAGSNFSSAGVKTSRCSASVLYVPPWTHAFAHPLFLPDRAKRTLLPDDSIALYKMSRSRHLVATVAWHGSPEEVVHDALQGAALPDRRPLRFGARKRGLAPRYGLLENLGTSLSTLLRAAVRCGRG